MPASDPRYGVAQVSWESKEGWREFCDRQQIDRAAFAEVVGLRLGEMGEHLPQVIERWVREARELKNERRRRG